VPYVQGIEEGVSGNILEGIDIEDKGRVEGSYNGVEVLGEQRHRRLGEERVITGDERSVLLGVAMIDIVG
jgi:hypothetical protein